jgi:hypothetical protein
MKCEIRKYNQCGTIPSVDQYRVFMSGRGIMSDGINPAQASIVSAISTSNIGNVGGDMVDHALIPEVMPPTPNFGTEDPLPIDAFTILALLVSTCATARQSSRLTRAAELDAQIASLTAAADKMLEAAKLTRNAAIAQAAMQIASGLMTIASGVAGCFGSNSATNVINKDNAAVGTPLQQILTGMSQVLNAVGSLAKGSVDYQAAMKEHEKMLLDIAAKAHEKAYENANETFSELMEIMRSLYQAMRDMRASDHEAAKAAINA